MAGFPALVIFDCDGVLIDSETIAAEVQAEALTRAGFPIDFDAMIRRFTGVADRDMYAILEREAGRALPSDYDQRVSALIARRYARDLKPIAGVEQALREIDLPICVASSAAPDKLRLGLTIAGLYERFAPNIFSAAEVARGKPAPDLFLLAAGRMRTDPARCLVIEDSVAGVTAAVAAAMPAIGFCGGAHCGPAHAAQLEAAGAALVIEDMTRLPGLIATFGRR